MSDKEFFGFSGLTIWYFIEKKLRKLLLGRLFKVVRITGLEPAQGFPHIDLNDTCIPISPYPHKKEWSKNTLTHKELKYEVT